MKILTDGLDIHITFEEVNALAKLLGSMSNVQYHDKDLDDKQIVMLDNIYTRLSKFIEE